MMRFRLLARSAQVGLLAVLTGSAAQAALVAEWDFRTNQNATTIKSGVSAAATLHGSATAPGAVVNTGTAVGAGADPKIANGYLDLSDTDDALMTTATYTQLFGRGPAAAGTNPYPNYATMTYVAVYRPSWNGVNGLRNWFFNNGTTSVVGLSMATDNGTNKMSVGGGRSGENDFSLMTSSAISWNSNTWYMVAMSVSPSTAEDTSQPIYVDHPGLPDGKIRIYVRALSTSGTLTPTSTPITAAANNLRIWNDRQIQGTGNLFPPDLNNQKLFFGNRGDKGGINSVGTEGINSDFAYVGLYDNFTDIAGFDAIFQSMIPEPASVMLLALGGLVLLRRR